MALRGSRIKNFDKLWCLVASGGYDFCVSSTSFQKNDIGWPQQHPTEKVLKFNMIFNDSDEVSHCQFFKNWSMKHKSTILLKPLGTMIQ